MGFAAFVGSSKHCVKALYNKNENNSRGDCFMLGKPVPCSLSSPFLGLHEPLEDFDPKK